MFDTGLLIHVFFHGEEQFSVSLNCHTLVLELGQGNDFDEFHLAIVFYKEQK